MSSTIVISNAKIYSHDGIIENGNIVIEDGIIKSITNSTMRIKSCLKQSDTVIDAQGKSVIPGFIDLQVNGAGGYLVTANSGEFLPKITQTLASHGTTSFLAAVAPNDYETNLSFLDYLDKLTLNNSQKNGANVLGAHMEAPFLNPQKAGANDPRYLSQPNIELFERFAIHSSLKMMTVSPELGDYSSISESAKKNNVVLSMGHTTATYEQAIKGYRSGIVAATHLLNTMNGISAREPGVVGATIESGSYGSVVCDGTHVHPANLKMLFRCIGSDRLIIITDSAPSAGTNLKEWFIDGMKVIVKGYTCYNEHGNIMGSSVTLNKGASIVKKNMECSMTDIIKMGSENPAKLLNIFDKKGSIQVGKDADIVILKDEDSFDIHTVLVGGHIQR